MHYAGNLFKMMSRFSTVSIYVAETRLYQHTYQRMENSEVYTGLGVQH